MTGHVRRRGDHSWELKFDLGSDPLTGKRFTRFHSFKGTKREAELELTRLVAGASKGEYIDASKLTLSEFLDRWERDWAANNVSLKTFERYKELVKYHARPHLGAAKLQKLKPVHFAELYAKLLREGRGARDPLSARTVGHVHRVLHRALGHAVQWGLIVTNPLAAVDPPPVASQEVEILSEVQARSLLHALRGRSFHLVAALGLATGMRRGEMLALRWKDVDLDCAKLRVEQSLEQTRAGLRIKSPKTRHGRRSIALPLWIIAELRNHWKAEQEMRLKMGLGRGTPDALVIANWDGSPRSPDALTRNWSRAIKEVGLPKVTLHALRHTHASQLIAAGMDVLSISRRLGHGSPTITLAVYGHLFSNTDDRAAKVIDAAFGGMATD